MSSVSGEAKLTPMMEQYRSIKKTLPQNTILFFRLGDFYEMFFDDAVRGSEILDITLTGRGQGEGRIPMCGIPYHAFHGYVRNLLDHNLKVAVCEQIGAVKPGKGLVTRKVTRIISPATYLEEDTGKHHSEYMISVVKARASQKENEAAIYGLACLELSTGEFSVREVDAKRLQSDLTLLAPREVILSKSLAEDDSLHSFVKDSLQAAVTVYEDWVFEYEECLNRLKENFKLASERSVPFVDYPVSVSAAGSVLYYLRDHLHDALEHVQIPTRIENQDAMILDRQTQSSLEIVTNLQGKKSNCTLLGCIDQTLTAMGARTLYQWLTHPLLLAEEIQKRQEVLNVWTGKRESLHALRGLLQGVKDMERTLSRLNYGVANARDLINLKFFLERVPEFQNQLASCGEDLLKEIHGTLDPFRALQDLITKAIVAEPPLTLKEGGIIRDGYRRELDELRSISKGGKSWILEFEKKEIQRTGIRSLKVKYSQVFGYTIEISKSNLQSVPEEYIRRQTLANAERFIVPELKSWDEKITGAQDKIKALEYELFSELREEILKELSPLQKMSRAIGRLDALASLAMTALQKGWVCPQVNHSSLLEIQGGRHPVVETMLPVGEFVENDAKMDDETHQLVVLTGPNMAGKSTYIRQVAQIVLLAQIGSYVPATSAKIGLVDRIFTRIGASDDLARGESTFMVEMLETAHILRSATSRSLLILDEVGRGTSTFDGVSIAWAICEHLAQGKVKPRTLFATHYHELTQLEEHFGGIENYHIRVKESHGKIHFLRKVVPGKANRSYGIHVAQLAGIPCEITQRAEKILKILESENTEATQIIEGQATKKKKGTVKQEPTLFDLASAEHPLLDEIRSLHAEGLTPLEALNLIAEWQKKLKE